eukprot:694202-Amphidinium_carterae.1
MHGRPLSHCCQEHCVLSCSCVRKHNTTLSNTLSKPLGFHYEATYYDYNDDYRRPSSARERAKLPNTNHRPFKMK